jgi:hypothetical protein
MFRTIKTLFFGVGAMVAVTKLMIAAAGTIVTIYGCCGEVFFPITLKIFY